MVHTVINKLNPEIQRMTWQDEAELKTELLIVLLL